MQYRTTNTVKVGIADCFLQKHLKKLVPVVVDRFKERGIPIHAAIMNVRSLLNKVLANFAPVEDGSTN
jgi:hypothetical protein